MLIREAKEPQEQCVLCEQDTGSEGTCVREKREGEKKQFRLSHLVPYDAFKMAYYYVIYLKEMACLPFIFFKALVAFV